MAAGPCAAATPAHGHEAGGEAVRRVVEAAPDLGIGTLTLFAFATANWQRPASESRGAMKLFHEYLVKETELCCRRAYGCH